MEMDVRIPVIVKFLIVIPLIYFLFYAPSPQDSLLSLLINNSKKYYSHNELLEDLLYSARKNDERSQLKLVILYSEGGIGIRPDTNKAKIWYRAAEDQVGRKKALYDMGCAYFALGYFQNSDSKREYLAKAMKFFSDSSKLGSDSARLSLATLYDSDLIDEPNLGKAGNIYESLVQKAYGKLLGNTRKDGVAIYNVQYALYRLADMYRQGEGRDIDIDKAEKLYFLLSGRMYDRRFRKERGAVTRTLLWINFKQGDLKGMRRAVFGDVSFEIPPLPSQIQANKESE